MRGPLICTWAPRLRPCSRSRRSVACLFSSQFCFLFFAGDVFSGALRCALFSRTPVQPTHSFRNTLLPVVRNPSAARLTSWLSYPQPEPLGNSRLDRNGCRVAGSGLCLPLPFQKALHSDARVTRARRTPSRFFGTPPPPFARWRVFRLRVARFPRPSPVPTPVPNEAAAV